MLVKRSNGAETPATVISYSSRKQEYHVRFGDGSEKIAGALHVRAAEAPPSAVESTLEAHSPPGPSTEGDIPPRECNPALYLSHKHDETLRGRKSRPPRVGRANEQPSAASSSSSAASSLDPPHGAAAATGPTQLEGPAAKTELAHVAERVAEEGTQVQWV